MAGGHTVLAEGAKLVEGGAAALYAVRAGIEINTGLRAEVMLTGWKYGCSYCERGVTWALQGANCRSSEPILQS